MGFRFSLESVNTIANLTFGKVRSCYRDIVSSYENYNGFMYFLDQFKRNLYSTRKDIYIKSVEEIKNTLRKLEDRIVEEFDEGEQAHDRELPSESECRYDYHSCYDYNYRGSYNYLNWQATQKIERPKRDYDDEVLWALRRLSDMFSQFKIKSLLLPGLNSDHSHFMLKERLLEDLVSLPTSNPYLILQPQDCPRSPKIFNAFPHFEAALKQADLWPAVLFWKGKTDYVFIPVKSEKEIYDLFKIIRYEITPMAELKAIAEDKMHSQQYIFHLSDLHIGDSTVLCGERRLKTLFDKHVKEIQPGDDIQVLITGDMVDSPNDNNKTKYENFSEYIAYRICKSPIHVLGNHDINNNGWAVMHGRQKTANFVTDFPKIERLEESKTILLLFNSNTNGSWAQGEIGQQQMADMGNILDQIENVEAYNLIAVLHHHIVPIPEPDAYKRKLFGKQIEKALQLRDAEIFIEWLKSRKVKVVLHGHKHIPFITEYDGINIIACGSSTGKVKLKEDGKTYLSYNILKLNEHCITCSQFVEDILGAGEKNIQTEVINF